MTSCLWRGFLQNNIVLGEAAYSCGRALSSEPQGLLTNFTPVRRFCGASFLLLILQNMSVQTVTKFSVPFSFFAAFKKEDSSFDEVG